MTYEILKLLIYVVCVCASMWALGCIDWARMLKTNRIQSFYTLYILLSFALGYLVANFFLDFMTIHIL